MTSADSTDDAVVNPFEDTRKGRKLSIVRGDCIACGAKQITAHHYSKAHCLKVKDSLNNRAGVITCKIPQCNTKIRGNVHNGVQHLYESHREVFGDLPFVPTKTEEETPFLKDFRAIYEAAGESLQSLFEQVSMMLEEARSEIADLKTQLTQMNDRIGSLRQANEGLQQRLSEAESTIFRIYAQAQVGQGFEDTYREYRRGR